MKIDKEEKEDLKDENLEEDLNEETEKVVEIGRASCRERV